MKPNNFLQLKRIAHQLSKLNQATKIRFSREAPESFLNVDVSEGVLQNSKDHPIFSGGFQYCVGVFVRPQDISKNFFYGFMHFEGGNSKYLDFSNQDLDLQSLIEVVAEKNKLSPSDLFSQIYFREHGDAGVERFESEIFKLQSKNYNQVSDIMNSHQISYEKIVSGSGAVFCNGINLMPFDIFSIYQNIALFGAKSQEKSQEK